MNVGSGGEARFTTSVASSGSFAHRNISVAKTEDYRTCFSPCAHCVTRRRGHERPVKIGDLATLSHTAARSPFVVASPQGRGGRTDRLGRRDGCRRIQSVPSGCPGVDRGFCRPRRARTTVARRLQDRLPGGNVARKAASPPRPPPARHAPGANYREPASLVARAILSAPTRPNSDDEPATLPKRLSMAQAESSATAGASNKPIGIHANTGQKKQQPMGTMSGANCRGSSRGLSNAIRFCRL